MGSQGSFTEPWKSRRLNSAVYRHQMGTNIIFCDGHAKWRNGNQVYGGGILNFGTLTVNSCVLTGNSAGSSGGGAIYNVGRLTVQNSYLNTNSVGSPC